MKTIRTPVIPKRPTLVKIDTVHELHLEAICIFAAIGFFLDEDTYWKDFKCLQPASDHRFNASKNLIDSKPWFQWHYSPRDISFNQALDEFTTLFETIIKEQTQGQKVLLPLSGGLDSRTQAAALQRINADVVSYSYAFENGYPETKIAKEIAKVCDFDFKAFCIPKGYLWEQLDALASLNGCYSDFTSPRQMAIYDQLPSLNGEVFSLGHWGDVLFDSMHLPQLTKVEEVDVICKKLLKKGGLAFATSLWETWSLSGNFNDYLRSRIESLLNAISIDDTNAKLRAFKSLYWAPRWTSVNLSVFESQHPISLPYYDDRMCEFICTLPEAYLNNRQLQIAYIQTHAPKLAKITWQDQRPFNLNTYHLNKTPYNVPYKVYHKLERIVKASIGQPYIQRNWELQFLGEENKSQMEHQLFNQDLEAWVPKELISHYFESFYDRETLANAHPMNMLLVLSKFNQLNASTLRSFVRLKTGVLRVD
jgi:hypothetical protein